jgi:hypothetical protein
MIGWLANALNIIGLILLGKKQRIGWAFGIFAECLWIWRANQVGGMADLIFISTVYCFVAAWNLDQWRKE